jgi:hypothetical protein
VKQLYPLRVKPYLIQQSLDGAYADLGPVISLVQMALTFGTGNHAETAAPTLEGMHKILPIHFTAARHLPHQNVSAVLLPLARQARALRNAVTADIHDNVRRRGLRHTAFLTPTMRTASRLMLTDLKKYAKRPVVQIARKLHIYSWPIIH